MPNHVITIKNCNNIREAHVSLSEGTLNIKFGYNGTGKSTISEAIRLKIEGKNLDDLTPFSDDETDENNTPSVSELPFHKVKDQSIIYKRLCIRWRIGSYGFRQRYYGSTGGYEERH